MRVISFKVGPLRSIRMWEAATGRGVTPILELKPEEHIVRSYLERALDGSSPSLLSLRLVQRFASETPDLFRNAALTLVESEEDSAALRFMIVKLLSQPHLMELLSDPARFGKSASIRLFRLLMQHDRALDVRLAQCLPDRHGVSEMLNLGACQRALDVLDEVSKGRRIVPILGHLVDHPIPLLSSKATLIVGRRVQSVSWAKRLLTQDRSPRDRANIVQGLWGLDTPEARSLMWEYSADKDNRVMGNAVFGLHVAGEHKAEDYVRRMAHREEPEFRWTSAWLMAKIGSDEHVDLLKQMIKDENHGVRRAALKALVGIRQVQVRKEAEEERMRIVKETVQAPRVEPQPLASGVETWPELAPDPQPELEGTDKPDLSLRLDGEAFSFRER